jgi:hypothetical protein
MQGGSYGACGSADRPLSQKESDLLGRFVWLGGYWLIRHLQLLVIWELILATVSCDTGLLVRAYHPLTVG